MKEEKKMNNEENLKNTRHYFDEIITSPQPSPRGEGVVVGEVTNHTNTGEVTLKANSCHYERSEVIQSELNQHILDCHGSDEPRNDMKKSAAWFTALNEFRCRTDRASNSTLCRKSAFSLLEKALRSGWDSLLCHRHSQARNPRIPSFANAHSSAFSLAEVMVLLTVIAIMMALAAPMLSGPADNNNADTVKKLDKRNLTIANGNYIRLQVGTNEHQDSAKLKVEGSAVINDRLKVGNFVLDRDNLYIFKDPANDSITGATLKLERGLNPNSFKFNLPSSNITLVNSAGYSNVGAPATFTVQGNGYIYGVTEINSTIPAVAEGENPPAFPLTTGGAGYTFNGAGNLIFVNFQNGDASLRPRAIFQYPQFIPISTDTNVTCSQEHCEFFPINNNVGFGYINNKWEQDIIINNNPTAAPPKFQTGIYTN